MATVKIYDQTGADVGEHELVEEIFGIEPNESVMHDAVVNYLANQRQGTFAAKTRAQVRGGGRKPWRQKGTGRARQGSIRSPQWKGGGVVFAKAPRDFSYSLPKKVRRLALKSAFSAKAQNDGIKLIDKFTFEAPRTKDMIKVLNSLGLEGKTLIVLGEKDENVYRSASNLPKVKVLYPHTINTYEILNHDRVLFTMDAMAKIEEVYK
ncbi:MAG TPA: 50S ribosomal protein L4 [Tissierellia bacterium]|jgi:large subunit ribosomal protein L4|nr:50S ribosomal protein L4 [Tissierellia bacterium]